MKKLTIILTNKQHKAITEECAWYRFTPEEFARHHILWGLDIFSANNDGMLTGMLESLHQEEIDGEHRGWKSYLDDCKKQKEDRYKPPVATGAIDRILAGKKKAEAPA